MSIAIQVEDVSKLYRLGVVGTGTISHDLNRWWHRVRGREDPYAKLAQSNVRSEANSSETSNEYVWALNEIDFRVEQGEILGIIGRNGAGKSTLLKLLSRVTAPTTGRICVNGRIASLLEVGTGFHPELTGRENVYLNGAILGMRRHEITKRLDEIVEFSGCAKYIDTPVKRYSSGMTVRLGFSVAAHLDCEVMVVDEVLAVGDASFQSRCMGKMQDLSSRTGRTILFVSHNMGSVRRLCTQGLLLANGKVEAYNGVRDVLELYTAAGGKERAVAKFERSDKPLSFTEAWCEQRGRESTCFSNSESIRICANFKVKEATSGCYVTMSLLDRYGAHVLFSDFRDDDSSEFPSQPGNKAVSVEIPARLLNAGVYSVNLGIASSTDGLIDVQREALKFSLEEQHSLRQGRLGVIGLPLKWSVGNSSVS